SQNGNFGLGNVSPTSKLHVEGFYAGNALARFNETGGNDIFTASASGTTRMVVKNDGKVGIGIVAPSTALHVKASGTGNIATFESDNNSGCTISDAGVVACSSDANLKDNINNLNQGLEFISKLTPSTFTWKNGDGKTQAGFI